MSNVSDIKNGFTIIGADGAKIGLVENVEGDRIKLKKTNIQTQDDVRHYVPMMLVASVHNNEVRLSANADVAIIMEETS